MLPLLLTIFSEQPSSSVQSNFYLLTTSEDSVVVEWQHLEMENGFHEIKSINHKTGSLHELICDSHWNTIEWFYFDPLENSEFKVTQKGGMLFCDGISKGKRIEKSWKLDELPWWQFHGFQLPQAMNDEKMVFYSLDPKSLRLLKQKAQVRGLEEMNGVLVDHVTVSLTGMLKYLGSVHYWFLKSDGTFLKFKSLANMPGFPETEYTQLEKKEAFSRIQPLLTINQPMHAVSK